MTDNRADEIHARLLLRKQQEEQQKHALAQQQYQAKVVAEATAARWTSLLAPALEEIVEDLNEKFGELYRLTLRALPPSPGRSHGALVSAQQGVALTFNAYDNDSLEILDTGNGGGFSIRNLAVSRATKAELQDALLAFLLVKIPPL